MDKESLYYKYTYMKEFDAVVKSCTENNGKYEITLENTCFYPEGGGQPCDIGNIGKSIISYVSEKNGSIIHIGSEALTPGQIYKGQINWERRFDYMQHHSAEHIVSGVINKLYGADNVGFHISDNYVTIDFNTNFTNSDIEKIEYLANEAVFKNILIKIDYYDKTPNINYRSKKELQGNIRIVTIDGYDVCACCGTQLERTGEIGLIKIISLMKYKGGSRLFMVCGFRALSDYNIRQKNIDEISILLSASPHEVSQHVNRLYKEKEEIKYQLNAKKNQLIDIQISNIAASDKLVLFEEDFSPDNMRRLINGLLEKVNFIAVFTGSDEHGYKYMISSAIGDISKIVKTMNQTLQGKGGGKGIAQGFIECSRKDIIEFFNE